MSTNTPETPQSPETPETPAVSDRSHTEHRQEPTEVLHPAEHTGHTQQTEALPLGGARPTETQRPETRPFEDQHTATYPSEVQRTQTLAPPAPVQAPPVVRGPYVAPVILGLVCLVIAAAAFAQEIANWTINWGDVGPLGIVVAGAVLVLLGGLGLLSSRRRRR